jgi:hypothetical protein
VGNSINQDDNGLVVNLVNDTVIANANSVLVFAAFEFFRAAGPWILVSESMAATIRF